MFVSGFCSGNPSVSPDPAPLVGVVNQAEMLKRPMLLHTDPAPLVGVVNQAGRLELGSLLHRPGQAGWSRVGIVTRA
jgi:hypothetical protein